MVKTYVNDMIIAKTKDEMYAEIDTLVGTYEYVHILIHRALIDRIVYLRNPPKMEYKPKSEPKRGMSKIGTGYRVDS